MHYFCLSFTHKNTGIALRERLSLDESRQKELLRLINANSFVEESLMISTCNRVEIFAFVESLEDICEYTVSCLAVLCEVDKEILLQQADVFEDSGVIHHLFSVASSLDSLVIGETQIAGQLKNALNFSLKHGLCGINLQRAVNFAFKCAARIRNETQISKNPISVASVAVSKAKELVNLEGKEVVVIGAGEMSELACKHLLANKARIIIINRSIERAKELCEELGQDVSCAEFSKLSHYINNYELFFSATNSKEAIINDEMLARREFTRYFFDIAVPRDLDLRESELVRVFTVDDLEEVVRKNLALREHQAQRAYSIISAMTSEFFRYLNDLALSPIIKALRLQARDCAEIELEKALKKGYLKHSDKEEAKKLIHQVFKAFLHAPTVNLRQVQNDQSENIINSMRYVFNLEEDNFNIKDTNEI
ncbi:glutamyl-tRNA reductase [Campylobacter troglodytis]|uniref:glutamyl-tRNA reductase n=1 Tax=Campylobacter troglodytis TaxID=654363 RepID=UPI00115905AC|nr:glutamyl-tRNA reductase [Campylobacter troglodytis]TQR60555.1 glutamyl-tRNA reductase [Campylobacter troglodytis]